MTPAEIEAKIAELLPIVRYSKKPESDNAAREIDRLQKMARKASNSVIEGKTDTGAGKE